MASLKFNNVYLKDYFTITGPLESNSKLKKIVGEEVFFDKIKTPNKNLLGDDWWHNDFE